MTATDGFPSGSWGIGPLNIQWSLKAGNEVDVTASILGINIDTLSGTLSGGKAQLKENLSALGLAQGSVELDAVYAGTPAEEGLWVRGELKVFGFDTGPLNHRIVSF